ncbi:hypothetical protein ACN6LK_000205 [Streptomyces griseus]|uniref:hypothetical protein n=1 Tax=Streptomyces griseus TaxID=1911 RepID=UPI00403CBD14
MSELAFQATIQAGIVSFRDFGTDDYPVIETGEEDFLFLPGSLTVMGESDADVNVEVYTGWKVVPGAELLFDGTMIFASGVLSVSEPEDPDEVSLQLPRAGEWRVRVYRRQQLDSQDVYYVFDRNQWEKG